MPLGATGNIAGLLSDNRREQRQLLLIIPTFLSRVTGMRRTVHILTLALLVGGVPVAGSAECYADYKAKQDNPLRLHYGVAQVSQCSKRAATAELDSRLAAQGWTLLNVLSVFDQSGLAERKDSAGRNYLRY
jgi:hypothetical protein